MEKKLCRNCGKTKSLDEFALDAHQFDGKSCFCKECLNNNNRKRNEIRKQGRIPTLTRFSINELMFEINYRIIHRIQ